jgi:hypothetical protein
MADFATDMGWSTTAFESLVWPLCSPYVDGGDLLQMEGAGNGHLARELDMRAGIDGWQLHPRGMRGIASRVQAGRTIRDPRTGSTWDTFTIRRSRDSGAMTEYEKRLEAVTTGRWLYPHLTIHAYLEAKDGPVASVGIARTEDIIGFIEDGHASTNRTTNASFYVVPWCEMRSRGYKVKILRPSAAPPLTPLDTLPRYRLR